MGKPTNQKRPRGRPPQPEGVRRRSNLTLRVRDETKAALERNAAANGRSLSEEAETLLDQALRSPQMLEQAFDLALDRPGCWRDHGIGSRDARRSPRGSFRHNESPWRRRLDQFSLCVRTGISGP